MTMMSILTKTMSCFPRPNLFLQQDSQEPDHPDTEMPFLQTYP